MMRSEQKIVRFDRRDLIEEALAFFVRGGFPLDVIEVQLSTIAPVDLDLLRECLGRMKKEKRLAA